MNKYVMKKWFYSEECDINNLEHVCRASGNLAILHSLLMNINVEEEECSKINSRNLIKDYGNYIGELKRVKKYIYNKKKKNRLELDIIKSIDYYYKESEKYLKKLEESSYLDLYNDAIANKKLCHGAYTHHSVLLLDNEKNKEVYDVATINFDKMHYGVQVYDLYILLRKAMEKNDWDIEMAINIIKAYEENFVLTNEEKKILIILMGYPEKYRKLINSYYNGKKSWLSIRIYEKLNELVAAEEKRQRLLYHMENFFDDRRAV